MKNFMRSIGLGSSRSSRHGRRDNTASGRGSTSAGSSSSAHGNSGALSGLSSRTAGSGEFGFLPERPRQKAIALREALNRAENTPSDLRAYAEAALTAAKIGSTSDMTDLDVQNKQYLADAYNTRFPDLKLICHDSAQAFFSDFMTSEKPVWRSLVQLSPHSLHHVAIDVRLQDGKRTAVVLEPAIGYGMRSDGKITMLAGYEPLGRNIQKYLGENGDMAVVQLGAQKSHYDCIIFSLNLALCAYQRDDVIDGLHERLRGHYRCFASDENKSQLHQNIEFIDGTTFLPPVFFKHSHARSTISEVLGISLTYRIEMSAPGMIIPGKRFPSGWKISVWIEGEMACSMSIEASRLRKIRKAIE